MDALIAYLQGLGKMPASADPGDPAGDGGSQ